MAKRRFRIDASGRGGELCIGKVNKHFVDFMIDKDESEIEGAIQDYDVNFGGDLDDWSKAVPFPTDPRVEDFNWEECNEIEHLHNIYSDNGFTITEVPADGSDNFAFKDETTPYIQGYHLYTREAIADESHPEVTKYITQEDVDNYIPVLVFTAAGLKGVFASWFVETDGEDFDPNKLAFSSVETNLSDIIENVWYDKFKLRDDYSFSDDAGGHGFFAKVGYMNPKKLDNPLKDPTDEYLTVEGYWEGYNEYLEDNDGDVTLDHN